MPSCYFYLTNPDCRTGDWYLEIEENQEQACTGCKWTCRDLPERWDWGYVDAEENWSPNWFPNWEQHANLHLQGNVVAGGASKFWLKENTKQTLDINASLDIVSLAMVSHLQPLPHVDNLRSRHLKS